MDWIENKNLKEIAKENLDNIEEKSPPVYRNALLDGISSMETKMLSENWENLIFEEENEKFRWLQKFEKLKPFLDENKVYFSPDDKNLYDFFKENIADSYTEKTKELNGFTFKNKKIFRRKKDKTFSPVESPQLLEFLNELKSLSKSANSIISENLEIFAQSETNKEFARDYIENLREEQRELIRNTNDDGEYFQMEEFNTIENEISQIQNNKTFKIREKIWAKSFGGYFARLARFLKSMFLRHKGKLLGLIATIAIGTASIISFRHEVDRASNYVKDLGRKIINQSKDILKKLNEFKFTGIFAGFLGGFLYYFGDAVLIVSKIIFTPITYIFTTFGLVINVLLLGAVYKLTDFAKYQGVNITAFSYFLDNKYPPDDLLDYLAKENNMTLKEYKEKYVTEDKLYDNFFAKRSSYIVYILGKTAELTAVGTEKVLDWTIYFSKILIGIAVFLLILYIIKWRS